MHKDTASIIVIASQKTYDVYQISSDVTQQAIDMRADGQRHK